MENKELKSHSQIVTECRRRNYDQIQFNVPKGEREKIKVHSTDMGESMNEFIRRAIAETMERDSKANT